MLLVVATGETKLLGGIELILLNCLIEVLPSFVTLGIVGSGMP